MIRYLLDTNVVITALRARPHQHLDDQLAKHDREMAISTITIAELVYGAKRSRDPRRNMSAIDEFIAYLDVQGFGAYPAEHAGRIRAELALAGTPIGPHDTLIAGHARAHGLVLVTNNVKEFTRVAGLLVEDWTAL